MWCHLVSGMCALRKGSLKEHLLKWWQLPLNGDFTFPLLCICISQFWQWLLITSPIKIENYYKSLIITLSSIGDRPWAKPGGQGCLAVVWRKRDRQGLRGLGGEEPSTGQFQGSWTPLTLSPAPSALHWLAPSSLPPFSWLWFGYHALPGWAEQPLLRSLWQHWNTRD